MQYTEIIKSLKSLANPEAVKGMARYGINPENTLGVSIPTLREMGKEIGKDHILAQQLWESGIHDAQILATIIDDPKMVTEAQMESWANDFNSWDICDQCCSNLFGRTVFAHQKVKEWSANDREFVKRAGFVLMAQLVVKEKKAADETFLEFLPIIKREAGDERNFVKKAVNWALRQIGKRNLNLNKKAIETAEEIQTINSRGARWIARDALRELRSEAVQRRVRR